MADFYWKEEGLVSERTFMNKRTDEGHSPNSSWGREEQLGIDRVAKQRDLCKITKPSTVKAVYTHC